MKIKLEWDFEDDNWTVRDEQDDRLSHSSRYDGQYVSIDEVENLIESGEELLSKYNSITSLRQFEGFFPTKVCLCGSTRFQEIFNIAERNETLEGKIVLTIGCNMKVDKFFEGKISSELQDIKNLLDELHLRKIDMCDEVLILNVEGYIGESTRNELEYARSIGKKIRFLEEQDE